MIIRPLTLLTGLSLLAAATPASPEKTPEPVTKTAVAEPSSIAEPKTVKPVVREASVTIGDQKIPYRATSGKLIIHSEDGKPRASIFHVSYERTDSKDPATRPVMFAFNGGPGSSSVWLHLGMLGPKIIKLPGDGTQPPPPPVRVVDNPLSVLDVCDLVFIDPVSTGYSRAEKDAKPGDFHGLDEDVESVGDFIRRWVSENDRWASPKYLLGESYGGIRAAGLADHLQSRFGMNLNGVILLSSLLDFATLQSAHGNDLSYSVFLPALTATAHFHQKITGDRAALVKESTEFAFGDYAAALLKGNDLDLSTRTALAAKLARLTGIDSATWLLHNLRLDSTFFRSELLRMEGKTLGRFDARVAWDTTDKSAQRPDYDPSYSLVHGAFSTAMLDYLGRDLGYKEEQPYEILTAKVQPWRWNADNQVVNVSDRLSEAMRDNPHLRVLVMGGYTDLATPPEGMAYSVRHMHDLPENLRRNITTTYYDGGHMFYLNPPDLIKCRNDLLDFLGTENR